MRSDSFGITLLGVILSGSVCLTASCTDRKTPAKNTPSNRKKEVVIFIYHRFGDDRYPSTNVTLEDFEAHLKHLRTGGFEVMTLGDAIDYLEDPGQQLLDRVVVLTVDDGFSTFYTKGMPLLRRYGFSATLFINPGSVGGADYMTWEQLGEVKGEGIEIGNHSHGHAHFLDVAAGLRRETFEADLTRAQKAIERHLGVRPEVYAYPYGEFDDEMQKVLRHRDIKAAVAQYSGVYYYGTDPYAIPRFSMVGSLANIDGFKEKATMKALRVERAMPEDHILSDLQLPDLKLLVIDCDQLRTKQAQCFVQGADCLTNTLVERDTLHVDVRVDGMAVQRRHNYTVTIPDSAGQWHWFSRQWIFPSFRE